MSPSFWQTVKQQIITIKSLLSVILISFIYFSFAVLIINYRFILASLLGSYSLSYKFDVIFVLLKGSNSAFSTSDFYFLILTSLLVGLNVLMLAKVLAELREDKGKLSFVMGGSTVLGVVVTGCSSCGFSIISVLGLAGALSFIPFGGLGLHVIIIAFLLFSLFYSLSTYHNKIACKIK